MNSTTISILINLLRQLARLISEPETPTTSQIQESASQLNEREIKNNMSSVNSSLLELNDILVAELTTDK